MDDSGSSYINNNNNNNNNTASYSGPSYITSSNPNLNSSSSTSSSSTIPAASNGGALGKLLPKAMVKRRKKIRGGRDSDAAAPDDNRARSVPAPEIASLEIDDSHFLSMADDEDLDGRSFGSFESGGAEPDLESEGSRPRSKRSTTVVSRTSQSSLRSPIRPASKRGLPSPSQSRENFNDTNPPALEAPVPKAVGKRSRERSRTSGKTPGTPPKADDPSAPAIVSTPPTPPQKVHAPASSSSPERRTSRIGSQATSVSNNDGGARPPAMSGHQRTRSGSGNLGPSKLSQITLAPLSPTPESGDATTPTSAGFFSSMFSAAQSAASTISSNIQGSTGIGAANKTKAASFQHQGPPQLNLVDFDSPGPGLQFEISMDKESAIQTIGSGDLSLSQLGIPENAPPMASPEASKFPDLLDTRFRSESAPSSDNQMISPILPPEEAAIRPRSLYETAEQDRIGSQADLADPRSSEMQRSPSAKSDAKSVRARGSSVTAANLPSAASMTAGDGAAAAAPSPALSSAAIPPAVSSATSSLAPPTGASAAGQPGAPKLTGFAIASKKRNRDFHGLFKSVPDDDYLIEDYSCALQREILAHGRLYVSEGHLCFSSNILGWVTTLVMSFDEIVSVEKRSTALVFKNGLMISTLHAKHIFASFTSRDATYDLIVNIWKLGHPTLKSTLNGVRLEGTGGDKTEKIDAEPAAAENETQPISDSDENVAEDEEEDDFYDEEDEGEQAVESQTSNANSVDGGERVRSRKVSGATIADGAQPALGKPDASADGDAGSFPGPATHAPTDCGDAASHYERVIGDEVIPAPLGKVYSLMFGPQSPTWMANWISGEQKCLELQMEDKKGLSLDNRSRDLSYIKPLYASIGPKQTKCMVTETLDSFDLDKAVSVNVRTQNPDVPNGNIFCVKTKYCLSWAENNATRVHVNCVTEWSGKSWLKGPIEKNVNEGQATYCKDLFTALKAAVSSRPRSATLPNGTPKKGKKGKKGKVQPSAADSAEERAKPKVPVRESWGLLEPIHDVAEPVVDILKPLFAGNLMYGLIVGLLAAILFRSLSSPTRDAPAPGLSDAGLYNPHRQMLYDEMWRREESELWDWLEERVGLERLAAEGSNARRRVAEPRLLADKLREERMDRRGVEEAIRVTEEKLQLLRDVVAKSGGQQRGRQ